MRCRGGACLARSHPVRPTLHAAPWLQPGAAAGGGPALARHLLCRAAPLRHGVHPDAVCGVHGGAGAHGQGGKGGRGAPARGSAAGGVERRLATAVQRGRRCEPTVACFGRSTLRATRQCDASLFALTNVLSFMPAPTPLLSPALHLLHHPALRRAALCAHHDPAPVPLHHPLLPRLLPRPLALAVVRRWVPNSRVPAGCQQLGGGREGGRGGEGRGRGHAGPCVPSRGAATAPRPGSGSGASIVAAAAAGAAGRGGAWQ